MRTLPDDVSRLLRAGHGVFSVAEAESRGISRSRLVRLTRSGLLVRLAKGVYAAAADDMGAVEWAAFAQRSRAFTLACGPPAAAAGWSAVAVLGLPAVGAPPSQPLAVVPAGARAPSDNVAGRLRPVAFPPHHRAYANGCRVTSLPRTVVDIARTSPHAEALVVADAALSAGVTAADLRAVVEFQTRWRGIRSAALVVAQADGFAESPLETLGRLTFLEHGLPVPVSNAWVEAGGRRYRLDHLLPDRWLAFEGDGSFKYDGRLDAGRVIADQREREWRLRDAGLDVVRYGWELARHDRALLAQRFARVIERCPVRPRPVPWWRGQAPHRPGSEWRPPDESGR
ncbi:type IV toxin-antitoxin system AbiEi family antitoxin domain-containing protein [Jiangella rhizosphaerae]|uniref:AbiEi antitoxin N-terminal domain-containing protein n=1 Tax=Jiangella rhizosphaerae TaxID=2293569 RepID=A0A418KVE7_9ACTN|nr:type IV toxin-antitoxin system AbiEi family antitoxin domain-containing protein [Jiangella rhizosphaerae]RIQ32154.1 hypothetical protein DY240_06005 [Jiangella rhizosphaerae]